MFDGILTELSCVGDPDHSKIHTPMSIHPAMVVHRGTKLIGPIGSQDRHRKSTRSSQILPRQPITSATEFFARRSPNFVHGGDFLLPYLFSWLGTVHSARCPMARRRRPAVWHPLREPTRRWRRLQQPQARSSREQGVERRHFYTPRSMTGGIGVRFWWGKQNPPVLAPPVAVYLLKAAAGRR